MAGRGRKRGPQEEAQEKKKRNVRTTFYVIGAGIALSFAVGIATFIGSSTDFGCSGLHLTSEDLFTRYGNDVSVMGRKPLFPVFHEIDVESPGSF